MDALFTMEPPPALSISGISYFMLRKTDVRFTLITRSQFSLEC